MENGSCQRGSNFLSMADFSKVNEPREKFHRYFKLITAHVRCIKGQIAIFHDSILASPRRDWNAKKAKIGCRNMTRKCWSHVRILIYRTWAITQDSYRKSALIFLWQVNKKELNATQLTEILDSDLDKITAGGNLNQKLSFLSSVAQAFVQQKQSKEDSKASKKVILTFLMSYYY